MEIEILIKLILMTFYNLLHFLHKYNNNYSEHNIRYIIWYNNNNMIYYYILIIIENIHIHISSDSNKEPLAIINCKGKQEEVEEEKDEE